MIYLKKNRNEIGGHAPKELQALFEVLKFFSLGAIPVYIVGYAIVASYLATYHIAPDDFLNTQYLAAGLSFLVFIVPLLFILWRKFENPYNTPQFSDH